jgi:hypothetical protein
MYKREESTTTMWVDGRLQKRDKRLMQMKNTRLTALKYNLVRSLVVGLKTAIQRRHKQRLEGGEAAPSFPAANHMHAGIRNSNAFCRDVHFSKQLIRSHSYHTMAKRGLTFILNRFLFLRS